MNSVELFAGAGGLGMGVALAGFHHRAVLEWDRWACETIRENQERGYPLVQDWPLVQGDVREFDFDSLAGPVDLVSGGPPCQPFSLGGKHRAHSDRRDMFPAAISVVRRLRPRAFLFENVKGLTRTSFANYFQYILLRLTFPDLPPRPGETWTAHLGRLERQRTSGELPDLSYEVVHRVVNAADFGIPQRRERVFIVGFRHDQGVKWSFPRATHSHDALIREQWVTGRYWEVHRVARSRRPEPSRPVLARADRLKAEGTGDETLPWRTVRDALGNIPDPESRQGGSLYGNHVFQPGARAYPGHTGSPLDLPAKTLKAGDHGVPGGENMLVQPNGAVRYFTVRESARLQTFPDGYLFHGSWSETMRQLGNAVPVALARIMAASIAEKLAESDMSRLLSARRGGLAQ